jgi:uncharacterized protein YkwD
VKEDQRLAGIVKLFQGVTAALVAAFLVGCSQAPAPSAAAPRDPAINQVISLGNFDHVLLAKAIFWESNRVRVAHGLPVLAGLSALDDAADMQANYMALTLAAGHYSMFPHEHDVVERVERTGLHPAHVAENAIMMSAQRPPNDPDANYTYAEYAAFLLEGWMNSPDHRANVLDPKVAYLGCAARLARGFSRGDQRVFAIQVFYLPDPNRE